MIVLDTDICIDLLRHHRPSLDLVERFEAQTALAVTPFTVQELVQGAYCAADPETQVRAVRNLLRAFSILDHDGAAGWVAGKIAADLVRQGSPVGDMDTMIAACAIAHDAAVLTRNKKHFGRVPGLRLVD